MLTLGQFKLDETMHDGEKIGSELLPTPVIARYNYGTNGIRGAAQ